MLCCYQLHVCYYPHFEMRRIIISKNYHMERRNQIKKLRCFLNKCYFGNSCCLGKKNNQKNGIHKRAKTSFFHENQRQILER